MEFDHLFICVPHAALEAELLTSAGFSEGTANRHPGQGTANRRFFFDNAFIELLFAEDTIELQSPLTKPVRLEERLVSRNPQTSPFGLCFRPTGGAQDDIMGRQDTDVNILNRSKDRVGLDAENRGGQTVDGQFNIINTFNPFGD